MTQTTSPSPQKKSRILERKVLQPLLRRIKRSCGVGFALVGLLYPSVAAADLEAQLQAERDFDAAIDSRRCRDAITFIGRGTAGSDPLSAAQYHGGVALCFEVTEQFDLALQQIDKAIAMDPSEASLQNDKRRIMAAVARGKGSTDAATPNTKILNTPQKPSLSGGPPAQRPQSTELGAASKGCVEAAEGTRLTDAAHWRTINRCSYPVVVYYCGVGSGGVTTDDEMGWDCAAGRQRAAFNKSLKSTQNLLYIMGPPSVKQAQENSSGELQLYQLAPDASFEAVEYAWGYGHRTRIILSWCSFDAFSAGRCIPNAIDAWKSYGSPLSP